MKKLTNSIVLMAMLVAQATKPYFFWAKEKPQLTEKGPTEYQARSQDDETVIILTKSNQRINQRQHRIVLQDTTSLMESNIMKIEAARQPTVPETHSELGKLLSRLSGNVLFGEKKK